MPTTAHSRLVRGRRERGERSGSLPLLTRWCLPLLLILAAVCQAAEPVSLRVIAQLASSLSKKDSTGALEVFDSKAKGYSSVESAIEALVAQSDVLCAIDVVEEKEAADLLTVDVDWYMSLQPSGLSGASERRRERVTLQLKKLNGKWKIISLNPLNILAPVLIR